MAAATEIQPLLSEAEDSSAAIGNGEFSLLLLCCAGSSSDKSIRAILAHPLNWERVLALVDHHRVVPQVYAELARYSHLIPAQHFGALRMRYQNNARKALWFTAELTGIVRQLESVGIQALPYKGPVLSLALYGEVTQRQFGDLDILVVLEDVPKAIAALRSLGYEPTLQLAPGVEPAYLKTGYEYSFSSAHGQNLLELQWRTVPRFYSIDFDVAHLFDRAGEIKFGESCMRTLCPEDLLLVLCVHAAKHVWVQLSWLCDIAQLAKSPDLDWQTIDNAARRLGIERILRLNLFLAHKLLGSPLLLANLDNDPQTTVLANEIVAIIESSAHYNTESIPYFRLMMRLRERWQDRARFLWRLTSTPSVSEWSTVRFPKALHPLYRIVRLWRLARRLAPSG